MTPIPKKSHTTWRIASSGASLVTNAMPMPDNPNTMGIMAGSAFFAKMRIGDMRNHEGSEQAQGHCQRLKREVCVLLYQHHREQQHHEAVLPGTGAEAPYYDASLFVTAFVFLTVRSEAAEASFWGLVVFPSVVVDAEESLVFFVLALGRGGMLTFFDLLFPGVDKRIRVIDGIYT